MLKTHHSAKSQGCKQRGVNWIRTGEKEREEDGGEESAGLCMSTVAQFGSRREEGGSLKERRGRRAVAVLLQREGAQEKRCSYSKYPLVCQ